MRRQLKAAIPFQVRENFVLRTNRMRQCHVKVHNDDVSTTLINNCTNWTINLAKIYLFKVKNRYTRNDDVVMVSLLLTLNIPHLFVEFLLLTLNRYLYACWEDTRTTLKKDVQISSLLCWGVTFDTVFLRWISSKGPYNLDLLDTKKTRSKNSNWEMV